MEGSDRARHRDKHTDNDQYLVDGMKPSGAALIGYRLFKNFVKSAFDRLQASLIETAPGFFANTGAV